MRIPEPLIRAATAALLAAATGCASTTAPRRFLPPSAGVGANRNGGWIEITRAGRHGPYAPVEGELIAVGHDSVLVLTAERLVVLRSAEIARAKLTAYDNQWRGIGAWAAAGTVSTLSHGIGLVLTAPIWLLVGIPATSMASYEPQLAWPSRQWAELAAWARFPAGLPPGLDPQTLWPGRQRP